MRLVAATYWIAIVTNNIAFFMRTGSIFLRCFISLQCRFSNGFFFFFTLFYASSIWDSEVCVVQLSVCQCNQRTTHTLTLFSVMDSQFPIFFFFIHVTIRTHAPENAWQFWTKRKKIHTHTHTHTHDWHILLETTKALVEFLPAETS